MIESYDVFEAMSALQKSIRRGLEEDSLHWATEMYLNGHAAQAWGRLLIIASEDIGVADSSVFLLIAALQKAWKDLRGDGAARLHFVHAVLALVRAPKSRIVDNALMVYFEGSREQKEIPDWSLDKHTRRGKNMGRGNAHFFEIWSILENQTLVDPYLERAKQIRK